MAPKIVWVDAEDITIPTIMCLMHTHRLKGYVYDVRELPPELAKHFFPKTFVAVQAFFTKID
jgi:hypothetical protein